ncbi:MAG: hypothetical protein HWN65_23375, partial [Candidatus Helarchaeota archaeon]|nr:hypothetical protein [Candidatus Helarchaeota archaeon]
SLYPSISVDNELNIHICWIDSSDINGTGPDADVFYKFYNRTAGIWKGIVNTTDVISGESSGDSIAPSIITGSIYLVWQDKTHFGFGTDWDIFFKSLIIIEAEGPGPEIDDDGGSKIWIIIIIIIGVVAGVAALFVFRTRSKPSVVGIKPSKMQLGDARSQLNQSESIPEKIHVLQKNNIPVELVVELYDPQLTDFFGQAFTSVPMELVEFLQKLDAPLEEKLEILEEFNNLTDELKQEFLEELTKI